MKRPFGRRITRIGDLLTMFINHLLNGMILGFLNKNLLFTSIFEKWSNLTSIFFIGLVRPPTRLPYMRGVFFGWGDLGMKVSGKRDFEGIWAHLTKKHGVCWCLLYIRCLMHEYFGAANCFGNDEKASWYRGLINVHHFSGTFCW